MNNKLFFQDKVIVITGASSGIGRYAALFFAGLNAKVVLASRDEERLKLLKKDILSAGGKALICKTDVSSFEEIQKMVQDTLAEWGKIDILIACAGVYLHDMNTEIDIQAFKHSMDINFFGTLYAIKGVLKVMENQGSGHIVILNSLDSKKGIVGDSPYVASKSALDGLGDVLRQELKGKGIRFTSIYPARVDTPMVGNLKVPWISPKIPPEKVVMAIIKAIKRNKAIVIVPSLFSMLGALNNLVPRLLDWIYRIFKIEGEQVSG